jgi:hypothetical protein
VTRRLELLIACLVVPPALELFSGTRVLTVVRRIPARRGTPADPRMIARQVDAVLARLPWVWSRTCLRRAVVLAALLRREGRAADVVIGVRRSSAGELEAHAWLRCDGVDPYLEAGDTSTYAPLAGAAPSGAQQDARDIASRHAPRGAPQGAP